MEKPAFVIRLWSFVSVAAAGEKSDGIIAAMTNKPRTFLLASVPLPGHLDWGGYLSTAVELVRRGHEVLWVSEARIASRVERAGVPFRAVERIGWKWPPDPLPHPLATSSSLPSEEKAIERSALRLRRAMDSWLSVDWVERGTRALIALAREWKPDVIVAEPFVTSAAIAAEVVETPYVQVGYPAAPWETHGLSDTERIVAEEGAARWKRVLGTFNASGVNWPGGLALWPQSPHLHICFWSREWYGDESEILLQTQFVGGLSRPAQGESPRWFEQLPQDQPIVFITLGSTFTDDVAFFINSARAATLAGAFAVVAYGEGELSPDLKARLAVRLPRCFAVRWVDYAHLFPRLAAIVHHGGVGTTHAAVVHGMPQVIVPHGGDQGLQARRAEANGVGIHVPSAQANMGRLRQALETVLFDPGFRIRASNLAVEFAQLGGVMRAADLLVKQ